MDESLGSAKSISGSNHPEQPPSLDWFLQSLVNLVNRTEFVLPVTLTVGGLLISGEMIGGREYFLGFAKEIKEGMFNTNSAVIAAIDSTFSQLSRIYDDAGEEQESETKSLNRFPDFVHLRNAKVFLPGQKPIPANRGVWWRGRLETIDGFTLGVLSAAD